MMAVLDFAARLESLTCCTCGVEFAMPSHLLSMKRNNGTEFSCPNGHANVFSETTEKRLRREKERLERELLVAQNERDAARKLRDENWTRAEKAATSLRRLKARVGGGACPGCKRSFPNLRRHMESKHPELAKER